MKNEKAKRLTKKTKQSVYILHIRSITLNGNRK